MYSSTATEKQLVGWSYEVSAARINLRWSRRRLCSTNRWELSFRIWVNVTRVIVETSPQITFLHHCLCLIISRITKWHCYAMPQQLDTPKAMQPWTEHNINSTPFHAERTDTSSSCPRFKNGDITHRQLDSILSTRTKRVFNGVKSRKYFHSTCTSNRRSRHYSCSFAKNSYNDERIKKKSPNRCQNCSNP